MARPAVYRQAPEVGAAWFSDQVRICAGGAQQCAFLPQREGLGRAIARGYSTGNDDWWRPVWYPSFPCPISRNLLLDRVLGTALHPFPESEDMEPLCSGRRRPDTGRPGLLPAPEGEAPRAQRRSARRPGRGRTGGSRWWMRFLEPRWLRAWRRLLHAGLSGTAGMPSPGHPRTAPLPATLSLSAAQEMGLEQQREGAAGPGVRSGGGNAPTAP